MMIARLAEEGTFRAVIDERFPFERIVDAYRVVDSGRKKSRVALGLDPRAQNSPSEKERRDRRG